MWIVERFDLRILFLSKKGCRSNVSSQRRKTDRGSADGYLVWRGKSLMDAVNMRKADVGGIFFWTWFIISGI